MNDEQEVFVSRRGRKTQVTDNELKDLQIDAQPTAPAASAPKAAKPRRTLPKPHVPHIQKPNISKRGWFIILGSIAIIILAPIIVFETVALQYASSATSLKSDTTKIAKDVALPEQKKSPLADDGITKTLAALKASRDSACRGGFIDNIAKLYPRSKAALSECTVVNGHVSTLINNLEVMKNLQSYEKSVDAALKPALAASNSPYAVIPDQVSAWQTTAGNLKEAKPPAQLATFHSALTQVVNHIGAQWTTLNNANNAQDTAAFKDAESKLSSFYESLRELSPTLTEVHQKVQTDITTAARAVQ